MRHAQLPARFFVFLRPWVFAGLTLTLPLACSTADVVARNGSTASDGSDAGDTGLNPPTNTDPNADRTPPEPPLDGNGNPNVGAVGLRYIGRANVSNALSWSNSALELTFSGTGANFIFSVSASGGNNFVDVNVDGNSLGSLAVTDGSRIGTGALDDGDHVLRVTKLNEARLGEFTLASTDLAGTKSTPNYPGRRIEFIGDSIAAAYGIDGNTPCTNNSSMENGLASFAGLTSATLGADATVIAWAGKGVWRNDVSDANMTPVTMPTFYTRTIGSGSNDSYKFPASRRPDAVVIMLGTNDYEYATGDSNGVIINQNRAALDHNLFVPAYTTFVNTITDRYPDTVVLLCNSPMLSDNYPTSADAQHTNLLTDLQSVAANANDSSRVHVLDIATLATNKRTGCGTHPNRAGHQVLASSITQRLRDLLDW